MMTEEQIKNATLAGGVDVEVQYKRSGPSPQPSPRGEGVEAASSGETVFVRQLPVREYPKLLSALADEELQAELFCGKPPGWAATLTAPSHNEVMQAGEALNKEPFFAWCARRTNQMERLAPGRMEQIVGAAMKEAQERSRSGSPKSPSTAG